MAAHPMQKLGAGRYVTAGYFLYRRQPREQFMRGVNQVRDLANHRVGGTREIFGGFRNAPLLFFGCMIDVKDRDRRGHQ